MKRYLAIGVSAAAALACIVATPAATPLPAVSTNTVQSKPEPATPAVQNVWVYYTMADDENMTPVPVARTVPDAEPAGIVRAALEELVKGPTDAEKAAGMTSWFSLATAGIVAGVTGGGTEWTVDFTGINTLIPNASTSAGSQMLLSQLNSTMFQFDFVQTVNYSLNGDCTAFWEWLQMGCHPVTRAEWEGGG